MPSRTSVTSENITVAPARTSRSLQKPTAGFAVTPLKASLPPHCTPTTSSLAGTVSRRRVVQALEVLLGGRHDRVDHRHEADVRLVLQADDVEPGSSVVPTSATLRSSTIVKRARRQEPLGLQLLAAQADHHHLVAEVRVQA